MNRTARKKERSKTLAASPADTSAEYRVGPGRPPREFQFKPGQSGNPKGARRKNRPIAPDLKALLETALSRTVTLRQGDNERVITKAAAGVEQLVNLYARGDRYARRDLIALAGKLGVDLTAGHTQAIEQALTADRRAILDAYVERRIGRKDLSAPSPVLAPAELLDDDTPEEADKKVRK